MTRPRVVHLHTSRDWGGGEYQILHLLLGLRSAGVEARLVTPRSGVLHDRAHGAGLDVHAMPGNGCRMLIPWARRGVARLARRHGAHMLHVHDSQATAIGLGVKHRLGIPLVYHRRVASPLRTSRHSQRKYSPDSLDAVIAISETVKRVMTDSGYPAERVAVVPSGLDFAALDGVEPDPAWRRWGGRYLVGGLGKLSAKKNWQFMCEVAACLHEQGMDIQWVLAGEGPQRAALEHWIIDHGMGERIHLVGFRDDASRLLRSLDLLFFPSLMEGASVTVREAMYQRIPVVAADAAGTVESLDGQGWVIPAGDVEQAARAVREALTDENRRQEAISGAHESARRRFSFDATVLATRDVYTNLLGRAAAE